jgi:hypothetical protein
MALHTETEIYAGCFELLGAAVDTIRNMRRDVKPILGKMIVEACVELDLWLRAANIAADKEPHLLKFLERLEVIEFLMRTCRDRNYVPVKAYAEIILRTQSIGKQVNGWRRAERERHTQQPGLFPDRQGDPGRASF